MVLFQGRSHNSFFLCPMHTPSLLFLISSLRLWITCPGSLPRHPARCPESRRPFWDIHSPKERHRSNPENQIMYKQIWETWRCRGFFRFAQTEMKNVWQLEFMQPILKMSWTVWGLVISWGSFMSGYISGDRNSRASCRTMVRHRRIKRHRGRHSLKPLSVFGCDDSGEDL